MKSHILIVIFTSFIIFACKEKPTYNPFDDQYNVSVNQLIKDNCDSISAGCGYFNLIQRSGRLKTYYQTFLEEPNKVVAKGFSYTIDSFQVQINHGRIYTNKTYIDSIENLSINNELLNKELQVFGYKMYRRDHDTILITNDRKHDTIQLYIRATDNGIDQDKLYRVIHYYNSPEFNSYNK